MIAKCVLHEQQDLSKSGPAWKGLTAPVTSFLAEHKGAIARLHSASIPRTPVPENFASGEVMAVLARMVDASEKSLAVAERGAVAVEKFGETLVKTTVSSAALVNWFSANVL